MSIRQRNVDDSTVTINILWSSSVMTPNANDAVSKEDLKIKT